MAIFQFLPPFLPHTAAAAVWDAAASGNLIPQYMH